MLNNIVIHGRLTADPELKKTQSDVSVCRFTVAVDRNFTKKGEDKVADFFTVVAWRGLADMIAKHFAKGKEIVVYGEMQSQKWTDTDGKNRVSWEIQASGVDFCGNKSQQESGEQKPMFEEVKGDEELPF